jgi:hypothetical protein
MVTSSSRGDSRSAASAKPLKGLRCLVCGMPDSKPVEEMLSSLGGKAVTLHKNSQTAPDVVVSDRGGAKRLQVRFIRMDTLNHAWFLGKREHWTNAKSVFVYRESWSCIQRFRW